MVGMLNVVTGIFVDSAVCTRTDDEVVQCWEEDHQRISENVKQIFREADVDESGTLSLQELIDKLENPWVKAYFSGLEIDPSQAQIIYTLVDTDGDNMVDIDEFVDGTMKLKGQAKSIDIMALMFDNARFAVKFNKLCAYIEEVLPELQNNNGTSSAVRSIHRSDSVSPDYTEKGRLEQGLAQHSRRFKNSAAAPGPGGGSPLSGAASP